MVEEPTAQAVTAAVETSPAATPQAESAPAEATRPPEATPQPAAEPAQVATPAQTAKRLRDVLRENPEYQREYDELVNQRVQKVASKKDREAEKARLSRAVEDVPEALQYAQERKQVLEAEDAAETTHTAKWQAVTETIQETGKRDPDWARDHDEAVAANRKEADELFAQDPERYQDWIDGKIFGLRVQREVDKQLKERLPVLVEARTTDQVNKALQGVPIVPLDSSGAGGVPTVAELENMSAKEYAAVREKVLANLDRYR